MDRLRINTLEGMGEQSVQAARPAQVELVYFEGCPHWRGALERIEEALAQAGRTDLVKLQLVTNEAEAQAHRMAGSPTILIDGRDPFPGPGPAWGCRLYPGEVGQLGLPSVECLVDLLS